MSGFCVRFGAPLSLLLLVLAPSHGFVLSPRTFVSRPRVTAPAPPVSRATTTAAAVGKNKRRTKNEEEKASPRERAVPGAFEFEVFLLEDDANEVFSAIDVNGDGDVSRDELSGHLISCGYTEVALDAIFVTLDANSDDAISRAEFVAAFLKFSPLRNAPGLGAYNSEFKDDIEADADAVFAQMDSDGDGEISRDELRDQLRRRADYSDAAVDRIFYSLDVDNDGGVSRVELRAAFVRCSALRAAMGGNWAGRADGPTRRASF